MISRSNWAKESKDVEHESAHRRGAVDLLRHGDERHLEAVERLQHLGEVQQGATQAVDLVDDHGIDPAGLDVGQQALQGWPVHVAAGEATVVVTIGQAGPALVLLAEDVRLCRFALSVQRVEFLCKPSSVDLRV